MSLDLRGVGIVDPDKQAELKSAFDLIDEIEGYFIEKLGITAYEKPAEVPPDLSEGLADKADALTLDELGILHAQYVAYAAFLNGQLSKIKAAYKVAESNLKHVKADISTKLYANDIPKSEVADRVLMDPLYREYEVEYLKLYMMRTILEARYQAYDTQASAISRLITLRGQEIERARQDPQGRGPGRGGKGGRPRPKHFG